MSKQRKDQQKAQQYPPYILDSNLEFSKKQVKFELGLFL